MNLYGTQFMYNMKWKKQVGETSAEFKSQQKHIEINSAVNESVTF